MDVSRTSGHSTPEHDSTLIEWFLQLSPDQRLAELATADHEHRGVQVGKIEDHLQAGAEKRTRKVRCIETRRIADERGLQPAGAWQTVREHSIQQR